MRAKRACSSASEFEARIVSPGLVGGIASDTEGKTKGKTEGNAEGMAGQFMAHGSAVENKGSTGPREQGRGAEGAGQGRVGHKTIIPKKCRDKLRA